MIGKLNHIAIAVPDLKSASKIYKDILGANVSDPTPMPDHGVTTVFVELPNKDLKVKKDQEIVVIESVKAASDILAPLDGVITEINDKIVDDPSIVNSDPLGEGWFFKMKLNNPSELDKLLDKDEYDKLTN